MLVVANLVDRLVHERLAQQAAVAKPLGHVQGLGDHVVAAGVFADQALNGAGLRQEATPIRARLISHGGEAAERRCQRFVPTLVPVQQGGDLPAYPADRLRLADLLVG